MQNNILLSLKNRHSYLPKFTSDEILQERKRPASSVKLDPITQRSSVKQLGYQSGSETNHNQCLSRSRSSNQRLLSPISHLRSTSNITSQQSAALNLNQRKIKIPTSCAKTNKEEEVPFSSNESSSATQQGVSHAEEHKHMPFEVPL